MSNESHTGQVTSLKTSRAQDHKTEFGDQSQIESNLYRHRTQFLSRLSGRSNANNNCFILTT
jgi:hypothetical protein